MFFDYKTIILIGGATASGKSKVAVELATAIEGEIINSDSTQLYKDMPTLTAAPKKQEMCGITHHLYGVLENDQPSSAMNWLNLAANCIEQNESSKAFITVGGTGLYFSSLMYGLSPIPEITEIVRYQIRQKSKSLINSSGSRALYDCLLKKDPMIEGRIHPHNSQRLMRAWEVLEQTGKSIIAWQQEPREKNDYPKSPLFIIEAEKEALNKKIFERCNEMVKDGVLDEVKYFRDKTEGKYSPLFNAIGYTEFLKHIDGECSLDEAIEKVVISTRQYAKKQQTWFRTQYPATDVFIIPQDKPHIQASNILKYLYSRNSEF